MPRLHGILVVCFGLVVLCGSLMPAGPAFADKRVALVIGNTSYRNVARLANTANDARLMADTLRGVGFTLVGGAAQVDLDEPSLRHAVQDFGVQLRGADVGLLYYAGHGVQVRGSNYLVPIDANPTSEADVDFQMVDVNLVLRQMESAGTKLNMVVLDACRNNPFGGRGLRATDGGLAQMRAPEGTLISFATQPGNVALDGSDGNSPFTKALAQTVRLPGLDIFQMFNAVGLAVMQTTGGAQQPWVSNSPIGGSFFFTPPVAVNTPPQAAPVAADEVFWSAIKTSSVDALFQEFLRQFPSSAHAAEARAKLEALRRSQVVVVAPPAPPPVTPSPPVAAAPPPVAVPPPSAVTPRVVALPPVTSGAWMAPLLDVDRTRIQHIAATREKALAEAAAGKPGDVRATTELARAPAQTLDLQKLEGNWHCRSFELGGILPLTVASFFNCRIYRNGQTLLFEKSTGSIRRSARLDPIDDTSLLFYGAYRATDDPQRSYGKGDDTYNEVGILQMLSPDRLRLELPEPRAFNEAHDEIVELVRAR